MQIPKPLPILDDPTSAEYWAGLKRHELLIQRCKKCNHHQFYPRVVCAKCLSTNLEFVQASGKGRVHTYTVIHQAQHPAFAADVPYVYAIIELAEGPKVNSNVVECNPDDVVCDMLVEAVFDDVTPEVTLVKFKPAK
ncbi:MAG: Zn-ribbon domain-containing OB-fold protein [Chloroflexota bacterium]|nr:Zn-ribbon domain-containing OB-fold protein [Chloroflexota bacterium]